MQANDRLSHWATRLMRPLSGIFLSLVLVSRVLAVGEVEGSSWETFAPPADEFDWIQLTSNEWLKGDIKVFFEYVLEFDSDHFGVIDIDFDDIKRLRSYRYQAIRIDDDDPIIGRVDVTETQVIVTVDQQKQVFDRSRMVAITDPVEREIDKWSGDVTLGVNIRSGNTDLVESSLFAHAERRTLTSRVMLDYIGNINETERVEVANNHRFNGSYDLLSTRSFFWRPLSGQYYRDKFQNIDHQATIETGLGFNAIDNARTELLFAGGIGVNFLRNNSVAAGKDSTNQSPAVSFTMDFETELTSWMDYVFSFQGRVVDEQSGTYQQHLLTTLSTDLIGNFDLDVSFVWDRIQDPQPRADGSIPEQDDYRLIIGLGYEF
jgi:hypothetical protein